MEQYIRNEIVQAEQIERGCCPAQFTRTILSAINATGNFPEAPGYRVHYGDGGYVWWPKEIFEKVYRRADGLNFGLAIETAKKGKRIARKGWNGKGMFLHYVPAAAYPPSTDVAKKAFGGENVPYGAYIAMKTAQGNVVPWLASQTDMLADDWCVLEDAETMGWEDALEAVKAGATVRREGWDDASWVAILEEPAELKGKICKVCPDTGDVTPDWQPEDEDLEAGDWAKLWGV